MLGFTTQSDVSGSIPEDRFFRSAERSTLYLSKVAISCADIQVMHSKHTGVFISASYLSILPQSRPQRSSDITSIEWLNPHHPLSRSYHRILSWNMSSDGDKSSDYVNAETLEAKGGDHRPLQSTSHLAIPPTQVFRFAPILCASYRPVLMLTTLLLPLTASTIHP